MGRIWVLDTETKGTGAQMVPLEQVERKPAAQPEPLYVPPERRPKPPKEAEPRQPRQFRVVDLMTQEVLAEGADTRTTVDLLKGFRRVVDVNVSVWEPKTETWRLLTLGERQTLWKFANG